ncbi:MAG: DUF2993 domain-containing protein [Microbacteriaceae bacterium]
MDTEKLELPDAAPATSSAPARAKRRGLGWLIALIVVAALGVGLWITGDIVGRTFAEQFVREKIIEVFALPASTDLDVTIGPGSIIAQAIGGRIDSISVVADDLSFGGLAGDVVIDATGIPLDETAPLDTLRVSITAGEEELQALSGYLSGIDLTGIRLLDSSVAIEAEYTIFAFTIPIGVELEPAVVDGQLSFQPTVITVNNNDISVDELTRGPLGGLAGPLLGAQSLCVSQYLPVALELTDARVVGGELIVELAADGAALGGPELTTLGTCT